ncbi:uncharacterized protein LOC131667993 isoform X3 [Phymastichus coffea]|uniref:uncharacterized protein LOC131667993 isoform X3 n=1 Tax=Phymastichus coffea TaxID=108790 RepID=UPI00273CA8D8|nr:uncharacterized protein LOC131667993 isoform X3 [Phymastichus coffea]
MKTMNVAVVLAIVLAAASAAPYSKFGRSCQDIGCRSDEKCIMAEEPCSYGHQRDQCGRYPTCQRINSGGESCTTKICSSGQYCRTENGRPTCVNTNAGLDPASHRQPGYKLPTTTRRPAVPTPPPRSSSYDHRFGGNGIGGGGSRTWDRNFGGGSRGGSSGGSVWDRNFGGGSRGNNGGTSIWDRNFGGGSRGGSSYTTKRPSYYPGGRDHYNTHTSTDSKGNRVWTFSG